MNSFNRWVKFFLDTIIMIIMMVSITMMAIDTGVEKNRMLFFVSHDRRNCREFIIHASAFVYCSFIADATGFTTSNLRTSPASDWNVRASPT